MITRIQKWGNNLALRIPKAFADELHWEQDAQVRIVVVEGKLVIEPLHGRRYELEELLAGVTDANNHAETLTAALPGTKSWEKQ